MKKIALAVALALGTAAQPVALAGTQTGTLSVSATVVAACTSVSAAPLNFGTLTAGTGSLTAESTITVNCGQDVAYSVDLNLGVNPLLNTRALRNGPTGQILYFLFKDALHATEWGLGETVSGSMGVSGSASHTVYGRTAAFLFGPTGLYTDTVTITLTY